MAARRKHHRPLRLLSRASFFERAKCPSLALRPQQAGLPSGRRDEANYVETVINDEVNGSKYFTFADLKNATASPSNLPAPGLSAVLAGGNDGLTGVADADYVGSIAGQNGIYAETTSRT